MRRLLAVTVVCALSSSPLFAAGARATASLTGIARSTSGQPLANYTVQLRTLTMGQVVGKTTSSAFGEYKFTGLEGGRYAVEVVSPAGQIVGTTAVNVSSGTSATGVAVAASAASAGAIAAVAGSAAAGIGTAAIGTVTAAAAAARVAAVAATRPRPSGSF